MTGRSGTPHRWPWPAALGAVAASLISLTLILASSQTRPIALRPARWAVPVPNPGLPNCFRVAEGLYRGAQPTREGFEALQRMGVRTVVNLRSRHSDRNLLEGLDLAYVEIPMNAAFPSREDFLRFLEIARDPARQPVFVHCEHGSDRTGTAVALFRVSLQRWDRTEAIREMTDGGFGFHRIYFNLKTFIQEFEFPPAPASPQR